MLVSLICSIIVAAVCLFLPGYPLLRLAGVPRAWSLCSAPAISASLIALLSLLLCSLGITNNFATIVLAPCTLLSIVFLLLRGKIREFDLPRISWRAIALFALAGMLACSFIFLRVLPSFDAFAQAWDNVHHLNSIRAFAQSGFFDSLHQSSYATAADNALSPMPDRGYYPSTWHAICALVLQITHAPGGLIENAVNFTFGSLVFPLAMLSLFACIFGSKRRMLAIAAFVVVCFPLFPWEMFSYGPLYANLASFACMPASMWMIAHCILKGTPKRDRIRSLALFIFTFPGILFMQPNSFFTMGILLAPLFVQQIARMDVSETSPSWLKRLCSIRFFKPANLAALFALACVALWCIAYNAPVLKGVVHANVWHWRFANEISALMSILSLSFIDQFYTSDPQILSALLLVVGVVRTIKQREYLWISFSYLLTVITVFAAMCALGDVKDFFAGFWYSDPFRCGAMACLAAMPLVALGADWALTFLLDFVHLYRQARGNSFSKTAVRAIEICSCIVFVVAALWPNALAQPTDENGNAPRANQEYPSASHVLSQWYSYSNAPFDSEENDFVERAVQMVGEDALVINNPYDGSVFAYGQQGLRTYYRKFRGYGYYDETPESQMIRGHLVEISQNEAVVQACNSIGAQYVIVLKRSQMPQSFMNGQYWAPAWYGIDRINDTTPGFETVLADGEMRLYRITAR